MMNRVDLKTIEDAHRKVAWIISNYGPVYLPIFERLENEIVKLKKEKQLMAKVLDIAANATSKG